MTDRVKLHADFYQHLDNHESKSSHDSVQHPTAFPYAVPTVATHGQTKKMSFGVNQVLSGIDAATFNANDANAASLKIAIALTLLDKLSIISDLCVTDTSRPATRFPSSATSDAEQTKRAETPASVARALRGKVTQGTTSQVNAAYTVTAPTSVYTAEQLYSQLSTAVTSGAFTADLVATAQGFGAEVAGCTATSTSAAFLSDDGNNGSSDSLDGAAIFGVVVGVLFVVAVIVGGIYMTCAKRGNLFHC